MSSWSISGAFGHFFFTVYGFFIPCGVGEKLVIMCRECVEGIIQIFAFSFSCMERLASRMLDYFFCNRTTIISRILAQKSQFIPLAHQCYFYLSE